MINPEQYIPLVHKITHEVYRKFSFKYVYEELFQMGCVGLMKAAKSFDEAKNVKFVTYAYLRIKTSIFNFMRSDSWYIAKGQRERLKNSYAPDSLDICLIDKGDTLKECLPYTEGGYNNVNLKILVDSLPIKLKQTLILRYIDGLRIKEVAQVLGIAQVTVVQRQKRGLDMLRKEMEA